MRFRWNWQILVSYFLLFSSLALLVSGIATPVHVLVAWEGAT